MKYAAVTLIVGVFAVNFGYRWMAEGTRFSQAAMFYMLSGVWTAILSAIVFLFACGQKRGFWRWLVLSAMAISILEGLENSACRFLIMDIKAVPTNVNLCDYVTGLPVTAVSVGLYLIFISWGAGHELKRTR